MCGIFGIVGHPDAVTLTVLGLQALQHRGQETAGIVSFDGRMRIEKRLGLVGDNFGLDAKKIVGELKGNTAIGHIRYSTSGEKNPKTIFRNAQPLLVELQAGELAVAHNGNFSNAAALRKELIQKGCIYSTTTDTEAILHLIAKSNGKFLLDRIQSSLKRIEGAYSLIFLSPKKLIGIRDPFGIRPLVLGRLDGAYVLASESCAFDIMRAEFVREVKHGEVVVISNGSIKSYFPFPEVKPRPCIFECIYFAKPDSERGAIYQIRKRIGLELARESQVDADLVVPVPDSSNVAALGFAKEAGIEFELGIIRNHYVGRTFIEPEQEIRDFGARLKYNPVRDLLGGKRIIVVDDSIVRGTTSEKIVRMLRNAGAREVHYRVFSPPVISPCFYGIDMSTKGELIAAESGGDVDKVCKKINADTLVYFSLNGLYRAVVGEIRNNERPQFCDACFTGNYPTPLADFKT